MIGRRNHNDMDSGPVRASRSGIDRVGLFANRNFREGDRIGDMGLGEPTSQGVHTIELHGEHRLVTEPWRFVNHACEPNARLEWGEESITAYAGANIRSGEEITIDYRQLPEKISEHFVCQCRVCLESGNPTRI